MQKSKFKSGTRFSLVVLSVVMASWALTSCGDDNDSPTPPAAPGTAPTTAPNTVTISIPVNAEALDDQAFGQNPLVVAPGTTVTWVNNDTEAHTVTSVDSPPAFSSGNILPGGSFSHTFNNPGTFDYFCDIHPNMTGSVEVQAGGASPTPSPSPTDTATPSPTPTESPSPLAVRR